jgi:hypothetical protein
VVGGDTPLATPAEVAEYLDFNGLHWRTGPTAYFETIGVFLQLANPSTLFEKRRELADAWARYCAGRSRCAGPLTRCDERYFREENMFYDIVTHPLAHPIISVVVVIVAGGTIWFWLRKI